VDVFLDHVDRAVDQQEIDRQRRIAARNSASKGAITSRPIRLGEATRIRPEGW
jgi:hypothetical protein